MKKINFLVTMLLLQLCCSAAIYSQSTIPADTIVPDSRPLNLAEASKKATPTVVHIKTYAHQVGSDLGPFEDLFHEDGEDNKPQRKEPGDENLRLRASGSGVIVTSDGYIITNNHITEQSEKIEVTLNDKRLYKAQIIGADPSTDLALIKIEEQNLPVIEYGNSDDLEVGNWVIAVGNPFNLTSTVTAGIVSAKGRNLNILGSGRENMAIESFIQTDAAVNPGNSGGALVNLKGELVGINTAIASPTGAFAGYSFAVPVNLVRKVVEDIMEFGQVKRGLLGIMIRDVNAQLATEKNIDEIKGVYVQEVTPEGAAAKAGLKRGDIIISIDGHEVNSPAQIQENVGLKRPGDEIEIMFKRNGKTKEAKANLKNSLHKDEEQDGRASANRYGASFSELKAEECKNLKIQNGVKVLKVDNGKLKEAGIREGYIITHINRNLVKSIEEIIKFLKDSEGKGMKIEGLYPDGKKVIYNIPKF